MNAKLIANPVSGTDAAPAHLQLINARLRERFGTLDIVLTAAPGDALREGERAAAEGCERLFIAGGDGTVNEVLNGVARVPDALPRMTIGIVPLGTGNDFAAALGLPEDVPQALDALLADDSLRADVCWLNDERLFVNVSASGFIAEVSDAVDSQLKSIAGKLAYLFGGAQVLLDYEPVTARVRATRPDDPAFESELSMQMVAVCNARLIGGGQPIAPHADITDGLMDVCLVESMPILEFVGLLARVPAGDHMNDPRVTYFRASEVSLTFERPIKVNTDGEVLVTSSCHYSMTPQAACFLTGPLLPDCRR